MRHGRKEGVGTLKSLLQHCEEQSHWELGAPSDKVRNVRVNGAPIPVKKKKKESKMSFGVGRVPYTSVHKKFHKHWHFHTQPALLH